MWKKESLEAEKPKENLDPKKPKENLDPKKPKEALKPAEADTPGLTLSAAPPPPAILKPVAVVEYAADAAAFDGLSSR